MAVLSFFLDHDEPAHNVGMSVEKLCEGVDYHICAPTEGLLKDGCHEGVIHDNLHVPLMGQATDCVQVADDQRGVSRRFDVDDLGVGAQGPLDCVQIRRIHEGVFNAESRKHLLDQRACRTVYGI